MELLTRTLTRMLMPDCHKPIAPFNFAAALDGVQALMMRVKGGELSFAEYESEAREVLARLGRSMDATALQRDDIDVPEIWMDGLRCVRVGRWSAPYVGLSGELRVERSLYRADGADRTVCPLEVRAGIVEGYWTPTAASFAMWSVAHLTPAETCELLARGHLEAAWTVCRRP